MMTIKNLHNKTGIALDDVRIGSTFLHNDRLYIKLYSDGSYNVFCFGDGDDDSCYSEFLEPSTNVEPVDVDIIIR